jgi:hypothetical protein
MTEVEALALSIAIEAPLAWLVAWRAKWPGRGPWHVAAASAVATAVTHPQLWTAALWAYQRFPPLPALFALEAIVVLVEGLLIAWMARLTIRQAMLVSLIANAGSLLFGLLLG